MTQTTTSPTGAATPPAVAQEATKFDELPLDQLKLIGIMGKDGDMSALFRTARGDIHRLKEGDMSEIGRVTQIDQAGVVVTRRNGNSIFIPPLPIG